MKADGAVDWTALLQCVRGKHPDLYRAWFEDLPPGELVAGELRVRVDDPTRADYLTSKCTPAFAAAAGQLTNFLVSVRFVPHGDDGPLPATYSTDAGLTRLPLNPDHTFEHFVVGQSNRLAHAAARAIIEQPGTLYNPLFVHGATGLGKSHLLQAVCIEAVNRAVAVQMLYISCSDFINDYVRAMSTRTVDQFQAALGQIDLLVLDDAQFLAGHESQQEVLFHAFNKLQQTRRQIVISADRAPKEIPTLTDRLVSRFNWGLVTQVDQPNRETRHAILQQKTRLRGYEVPDDVLDYIARCVQDNIRDLEGALTRLIVATTVERKPMSIDTARETLRDYAPAPRHSTSIRDIVDVVVKHYRVKLPDLISRKRSRSVSEPRQVAMYLARKLTPMSLGEIGEFFGGRDHSTVLHAERTIDGACKRDKSKADTLTYLSDQLLFKR